MRKILIITICLITGMVKAFSQDEATRSVTYTIDSSGNLTVSGMEPTGSTADFTNTYGKTQQMTSGKTSVLTLKNYKGYMIKGLQMEMHSNASTSKNKGAGTFSFKYGDEVIASLNDKPFKEWYNMTNYINTFTCVKVKFNEAYADGFDIIYNNDLTITITATENSLYIQSYTIIYQKMEGLVTALNIESTVGDVFCRKQQILISCEDEIDDIYYTLDDTEPTTESNVYDENVPLYIDKTTTIKAIAVKDDEQTKVWAKTFVKDNRIKVIVADYKGKFYRMTKNSVREHLASGEIFIYDNMFFCDPKNIPEYGWLFHESGKIQDCGSDSYLCNTTTDSGNHAETKLGGSDVLWDVSDGRITLVNESNRSLFYSDISEYKYFAAFDEDYAKGSSLVAPAYPVDLVKGYARNGLEAGDWGTVCLPYDVLSDDRNGTYYSIAGKRTENDGIILVLEEETGTLTAGQPYIFEATDEALYCMYLDVAEVDNVAESAGERNGLIGSFTQTSVAEGMYVVKDNAIRKCDDGWGIKANKAYIDMDKVPEYNPMQASAKRVVKMNVGGNTTGVSSVREERNGAYYNMQGQRVAAPSKGLYIINGKKIIVK